MTTEAQAKKAAGDLAVSVAVDLRVVLLDAQRELKRFEEYVDSWDDAVRTSEDPREFTELFVAERALTMVDELVHMPTGGTQHMHVRAARRRLLELMKAAG